MWRAEVKTEASGRLDAALYNLRTMQARLLTAPSSVTPPSHPSSYPSSRPSSHLPHASLTPLLTPPSCLPHTPPRTSLMPPSRVCALGLCPRSVPS
eukprot:2965027-Prymnesium_polylepis.2